MSESTNKKSTTSTAVKRKYNNKVYSQIKFELPKDLVAQFKEACKANGVSQASVIRKAMEDYVKSEALGERVYEQQNYFAD